MGDRKYRCICFFLTFLYFMSIHMRGNIWHYNIFNVRAISGIYKYNIVVSFSVKTTFQTTGLVIDGPVYILVAFACPARRVRVGVSILHGTAAEESSNHVLWYTLTSLLLIPGRGRSHRTYVIAETYIFANTGHLYHNLLKNV